MSRRSSRFFDPHNLQYLQRIGSRWYARVPVPNPLRPRLGPYLRRTLETSDLGEAQRRRVDVLAWARGRFREEMEKQGSPVQESYAAFLSRLKAAGPVEDVNVLTGEPMTNPAVDVLIDQVEAYQGPDKDERVEALQDFIAGRETISAVLASYLEANPKRSSTTAVNHRKAVDL